MKKCFNKPLLLLTCFFLTTGQSFTPTPTPQESPTPAPTVAPTSQPTATPSNRIPPSSATLSTKYRKNGDLNFTVVLDRKPTAQCFVRFFGLLSNLNGDGTGLGTRKYLGVRRTSLRTLRVAVRKLPEVRHVSEETGIFSVAQLNLQAQLTCGTVKFETNAQAHLLDCGRPSGRLVSPQRLVELIKHAID